MLLRCFLVSNDIDCVVLRLMKTGRNGKISSSFALEGVELSKSCFLLTLEVTRVSCVLNLSGDISRIRKGSMGDMNA